MLQNNYNIVNMFGIGIGAIMLHRVDIMLHRGYILD